jgi:hypothetical protein
MTPPMCGTPQLTSPARREGECRQIEESTFPGIRSVEV